MTPTETKRLLTRARDALNEFARAPAAFGGTYCKICCTYEHTPDCIISQLDAALKGPDHADDTSRDVTAERDALIDLTDAVALLTDAVGTLDDAEFPMLRDLRRAVDKHLAAVRTRLGL